MSDLVKDLRFWNGGIDSDKKMRRAADRIEQLEGDIVKYSGTVADLRMDSESLIRNFNRAIDVLASQRSRIEQLEADKAAWRGIHEGAVLALQERIRRLETEFKRLIDYRMVTHKDLERARAVLGKDDGEEI